jgi:probable HAF family extracellular repeat protein
MNKLISSVIIPGLLLFASAGAQATSYTVTDLGIDGCASDINANGQVVGWSYNPADSSYLAFLYSDGAIQNLGTLGGSHTLAYGINSSGEVVGQSFTSAGSPHAFLYSNGEMKDLGTLGGSYSIAYGINSSGEVVGQSSTSDGSTHAFLYSNGEMKDLGTFGGSSSCAQGINDNGQIVGSAETADFADHAFLYQNGIMQNIDLLGTIKTATKINNSGQVIGISDGNIFLCNDGVIKDLGNAFSSSIPSEIHFSDINTNGLIVGSASRGLPIGENTVKLEFLPFLNIDGNFMNLNDLIAPGTDWTLYDAIGINDSGQIVGFGAHNGKTCAFVLTPVPEPSTLIMMATGLISLLLTVWQHQNSL